MTMKRDRPSTPENDRQNTRSASRMSQIENMTDPDDRRRRAHHSALSNLPTVPQAIEQPNFGLALANMIPQVQIPDNLDAPFQFPRPAIPLLMGNDPFAMGGQERPITGWRDMMNNLPPMPVPPRRGRVRHDVALNNVHRGQIAHREQAENHRMAQERQRQAMLLQQLQEQRLREQQEEQERQR